MRNLLIPLAAAALLAAPAAAEAQGRRAQAIFAGGCFWCTESDFDKIPGVLSTTSGYTGGKLDKPTYEQVSGGGTGHIEAVRVIFNPGKVSYTSLAERFFQKVDPLDAGGQFRDRGYQYRSAIFVADDGQRRTAAAAKAKAAAALKQPIATLILPAATFHAAEGYHQDYYKKNPAKYSFYRWNCGRDAKLKQIWRHASG